MVTLFSEGIPSKISQSSDLVIYSFIHLFLEGLSFSSTAEAQVYWYLWERIPLPVCYVLAVGVDYQHATTRSLCPSQRMKGLNVLTALSAPQFERIRYFFFLFTQCLMMWPFFFIPPLWRRFKTKKPKKHDRKDLQTTQKIWIEQHKKRAAI